jgi:hypothetical protein
MFQVTVLDLGPREPDSYNSQKELLSDQRPEPSRPGWIEIEWTLQTSYVSQLMRILDVATQLQDPLDSAALQIRSM